MRLLLDTNVLIAWIVDGRLSAPARDAIADPSNDALLSVIALWEFAAKQSVGKLTLVMPTDDDLRALGFEMLGVTSGHARRMATLPLHHRDPFDRMLVAQALEESLTLVTTDRRLAEYGIATIAA